MTKQALRFGVGMVLCLALMLFPSGVYAHGGGHGGGHVGGHGWGHGGRGWGWGGWGWNGDSYWDWYGYPYWGWGGLAPGYFIGSAVATGYQLVNVNGVPYYYANGYYYQQDSYGHYVVVNPPGVVQQPVVANPELAPSSVAIPISSPQSQTQTQNTFTVNIPNDSGGYTPVTLKKLGNGFIGPQGEYYEEFPKVKQLKAMYGK